MNAEYASPNCALVMLVEDSPLQARLVQHAIDKCDSLELVHTACDGQAALDYLHQMDSEHGGQRPDLILLDLEMPRKDGFAVLREIKQDDKLKTIPVVMLTSRDSAADIARCYADGASTYLAKPMSFDRLAEVLADFGRYWSNAKLPVA